jgi:hypothetical protein
MMMVVLSAMWSGCAEAPTRSSGEGPPPIAQPAQPSAPSSARDSKWQQTFTAGKAAAEAGRDAEAERALQAALGMARECNVRLGPNDFIQSLDNLSQFLEAHFPKSLADPFNRQRAYLANLYP